MDRPNQTGKGISGIGHAHRSGTVDPPAMLQLSYSTTKDKRQVRRSVLNKCVDDDSFFSFCVFL